MPAGCVFSVARALQRTHLGQEPVSAGSGWGGWNELRLRRWRRLRPCRSGKGRVLARLGGRV